MAKVARFMTEHKIVLTILSGTVTTGQALYPSEAFYNRVCFERLWRNS
jgi:hypothetical protein